MKASSYRRSSLLMAPLILTCVHGFPILVGVNTTRDIASQYSNAWDIQKRLSRRLENNRVYLSVTVSSEAEMTHLNHLQNANMLSYEITEESPPNHRRNLQTSLNETSELSCYRTVEEILQTMDKLATEFPDFITVKTIGESWLKKQGQGGYDIKVMVLTAPSGLTNKNNMVIVGGHHGRELPPPEVVLRWAEYLLEHYHTQADVAWILNRTNFHLIPMANPDGRKIVESHLDWEYRKNAQPYGCGDESKEGVDLNRNYPMWWGDDLGSSSNPCSPSYRSTNALSEPESQAIYQYASALFDPEIKKGSTPLQAQELADKACPKDASGLFIDMHSFGEYVYFPWAYNDTPSPNHNSLLTLAAKLAQPGNYTLWGPGQESFLYAASGDVSDSLYGIDCVASVGYEVGSEFYASCTELNASILPTMMESLLYASKTVGAPYTIPLGPDIVGIDIDASDPAVTKLSVNVSDDAKIVPHANFAAERRDAIFSVSVYLDEHPEQVNSKGVLMDAKDGLLASAAETAIATLDTFGLEPGRHTLYFLARDRQGHDGPVSAVFVDYPEQLPLANVVVSASEAPEPIPEDNTKVSLPRDPPILESSSGNAIGCSKERLLLAAIAAIGVMATILY